MSSAKTRAFVRGVVKGLGAVGVGTATRVGLKVAGGRTPTVTFDSINPMAGPAGIAGLAALVAGLAISGETEKGEYKKHAGAWRLVSYGLLAAVGATLDPDPSEQFVSPAPRSVTAPPLVAQEYRNWIPQYAPSITFPNAVSSPTTIITDVATQVPRYSNVF